MTVPKAPKTMYLTMVGSGEPLLRLQKRLACAATELGITLQLGIDKDYAARGLEYSQTPAVMANEKVLMSGLKRTEEIVSILRAVFASEPDQ